jgi:hypothetical protein
VDSRGKIGIREREFIRGFREGEKVDLSRG